MPDIVILAQASYFVDKVALLNKMPKSEKGDHLAKYLRNFTNLTRSSTLWIQSVLPNTMSIAQAQAVLQVFC